MRYAADGAARSSEPCSIPLTLPRGATVKPDEMLPVQRGLTVLAAAGSRHTDVADWLFDLLGTQPSLLTHANAEVVRLVAIRAPTQLQVQMQDALPRSNTDLLRPARDLALRLLHALPADAPAAQRAQRLAWAGVRMSEAGDRRAALKPTRQAADLYRRLAEAEPAHLPDLAMALNNLGVLLSQLGDRQAALREYEIVRRLDSKLAHCLWAAIQKNDPDYNDMPWSN